MTEYAPGMRTIIRDEEWMIRKVETNTLGNKTLYCVGISPLVKDRESIFLTDLEEIKVVDPADVKLVTDHSSHYKRSLLYLESQWRQKIPTDTNIHVGWKAAMDPMPYQLDPAKMALQKTRQRILIADTVGLGKTLEAGILMSELIARGKGRRILVVTVKSMMTQFQKEMWNRFTIPLVRLDSARIQKIRANLPSNYNPFFYYDKTIVSIDTLKRDVEYRTHLEHAYWDIIVIDEAQNVADRGDHQALRARLAKLLAGRSDTMIMLSATPHDGKARSFASLMNMLDPTAIADPDDYRPEDVKGLFIRRFKKDIQDQSEGAFLERTVNLEHCRASAREEYAFEIFSDMQLQMDVGRERGNGHLFKTSLEKALFSSPAACIKSIDVRLKKLNKKYGFGDIKDIGVLESLRDALGRIQPKDFSRYQELLKLLNSPEYAWDRHATDDRLVIFTERIETMKYLAQHLREDLGMKEDAVQEISGGMSDEQQQKIVEDFGRTESPIRILVASDVASEGLNLHYLSHRLIHFDIPWSLMVFQQRNGRIDRYGQKKKPDIRYMVIESNNKRIKGDVRILEILVQKEEQALKNIGDPSLLMGKFTIEAEKWQVLSDSDGAEAFARDLQNDAPGAQIEKPLRQRLRLFLCRKHMYSHVGAVLHIRDQRPEAQDLGFEPFELAVGAIQLRLGPGAHRGKPRRVQRVGRAFGVGAQQPPGAQQHTAEIPRHHTDRVRHAAAAQHLQHRDARAALGLTVVAVALGPALDRVAPAVVPCVIVFFLHLVDEVAGLFLGLDHADVAEKAGALFGELRLPRAGGYEIFAHVSQSSFGSV